MCKYPIFGVLAGLVACDSAPTSHLTVLDSAGVQLVVNDSVDRVLDWRLEPVARYGGEPSGPASFYELDRGQVAIASDGTIYVLDRAAKRVTRIRPNGAMAIVADAEGEGPGEFTRPVGIAVAPSDDIVVLDAGRGRYIRYAEDGTLRGESVASSYGSFAVIGDSTIVARGQEYGVDGYYEVLRAENTGRELARTGLTRTTRYRLTSCGGGFNIRAPVIFAPEMVWAVSGELIAVNSEIGYNVRILQDGEDIRHVRRAFAPRPATVPLAEAWARANPSRVFRADGSDCVHQPTEVVEKREFADSVPALAEMLWNGRRELWVARWSEDSEVRRTDVFDSVGVYQGTVPVDMPHPIGFLPSGEALYVERDALDIERLVVARIVR